MKDMQPRYAPESVLVDHDGRMVFAPVLSWRIHAPGTHTGPLVKSCTALEMVTAHGSRWWGVDKGWINSELRMVVQGFDDRNEILRSWKPCNTI